MGSMRTRLSSAISRRASASSVKSSTSARVRACSRCSSASCACDVQRGHLDHRVASSTNLETTGTTLPCRTHLPEIVRPRLVQRAQRRLRLRAARREFVAAHDGTNAHVPLETFQRRALIPALLVASPLLAKRIVRVGAAAEKSAAPFIHASLLSLCNERGDRHVEAIVTVATTLEGGGQHAPRCARASAGESCRRSVLLFFESLLFARILNCAAARLRIVSLKARTRPSASQAVCSPSKSVAGRFLRVRPFQYTVGFAGGGLATRSSSSVGWSSSEELSSVPDIAFSRES